MSLNLIEKVYAQAGEPAYTLLQKILTNIINPIITLMMAVAVIFFLWGVFDFVRNADSSDKRKEGGTHMLWGAIGLFIMVTAYGILNLILGTIKGI
jgi:hypothetical protein